MGFTATGEGHVTFTKSVEEVRLLFGDAFKELYEYWFEEYYKPTYDTIYLSATSDRNYHDDFVLVLDRLSPVTKDGIIEFIGGDNSRWCFRFDPEKQKWLLHNGNIVYDDEFEMLKTIKNAFLAYVENDYAAASNPDYIKTVLTDVCGLNEASIKEYGLGWIISDEK